MMLCVATKSFYFTWIHEWMNESYPPYPFRGLKIDSQMCVCVCVHAHVYQLRNNKQKILVITKNVILRNESKSASMTNKWLILNNNVSIDKWWQNLYYCKIGWTWLSIIIIVYLLVSESCENAGYIHYSYLFMNNDKMIVIVEDWIHHHDLEEHWKIDLFGHLM